MADRGTGRGGRARQGAGGERNGRGFGSDHCAQDDTVETTDVFDLIRKLRHKEQDPSAQDPNKRMIAASPVSGAKPSAGVILGVACNAAFYRGDPSTTHISSGVGSVTVTSKGHAGINAHNTVFGRDDRWRLEADYRFQWTSQETFGLGLDTASSDSELLLFDFYRLHQSAQYRLRPHLFGGGALDFDSHADVGFEEGMETTWPESAYYQYSVDNGLPLDTQISAGPGVDIIWDSRDNFINPDRGWLARASYRAMFDGFLGGDSDWEKVTVDVRAYPALSSNRRHRLAIWLCRPGGGRGRPVLRPAVHGKRSVRALRTRLRRGSLPRPGARIRRDRVSGPADAQWPAGYGGVPQRYHDLEPAGGRGSVRSRRSGRWRRAPASTQQAVEDQPGVRYRVWREGKLRRVPGGTGGVLT